MTEIIEETDNVAGEVPDLESEAPSHVEPEAVKNYRVRRAWLALCTGIVLSVAWVLARIVGEWTSAVTYDASIRNLWFGFSVIPTVLGWLSWRDWLTRAQDRKNGGATRLLTTRERLKSTLDPIYGALVGAIIFMLGFEMNRNPPFFGGHPLLLIVIGTSILIWAIPLAVVKYSLNEEVVLTEERTEGDVVLAKEGLEEEAEDHLSAEEQISRYIIGHEAAEKEAVQKAEARKEQAVKVVIIGAAVAVLCIIGGAIVAVAALLPPSVAIIVGAIIIAIAVFLK